MLHSEDYVIVQLYEVGDAYDARRSGSPRSLRLSRSDGRWTAGWSNGPFDSHRVEVIGHTPLEAVNLLALTIDDVNCTDAEEEVA